MKRLLGFPGWTLALVPVSLLAAGCAYPTAVTVGRSPVAYTPPPPGMAGAAGGGPVRPTGMVTTPPPMIAPPPAPPYAPPVARNADDGYAAAGAAPEQPKALVVPAYTAPVYGRTGPVGPGG